MFSFICLIAQKTCTERKNLIYFVKILNGNGIFINLLHMIIQYSVVLLPPPPLISHRDQENINKDMIHTDILL